jgi:hypothetical protein
MGADSGSGSRMQPKRRRLRKGAISAAVEQWLPDDLSGADRVRGEVARRLAVELDARSAPAHAVPRLANALVAVVAEIEPDARADGDLNVKRLLEEVYR